MIRAIYLLMFLTPVVALLWRIVVTKTRKHWIRAGAAAAAMASAVGGYLVFDQIGNFSFSDWRDVASLAAAMAASAYLVFWALRRHANRRHRTISLIAAVIGVVPAFGALANAMFFEG